MEARWNAKFSTIPILPFPRIEVVTITFPDRETEKRALGFLLGRFSGRVLRTGEHLVPETALEALADQDIPFAVRGKSTAEPDASKSKPLSTDGIR